MDTINCIISKHGWYILWQYVGKAFNSVSTITFVIILRLNITQWINEMKQGNLTMKEDKSPWNHHEKCKLIILNTDFFQTWYFISIMWKYMRWNRARYEPITIMKKKHFFAPFLSPPRRTQENFSECPSLSSFNFNSVQPAGPVGRQKFWEVNFSVGIKVVLC